MLLTEIPPGGNLTQWFYNLFNQIKSENQASAPQPVSTDQNAGVGSGSVAQGPVSPVISSQITMSNSGAQGDSSMLSQAAVAGVSYLTASYGTMLLEAELAVPGPPGPFAVLPQVESGGDQSAQQPTAQSTVAVAASQAAEAYQVSARTQASRQNSGLSSST